MEDLLNTIALEPIETNLFIGQNEYRPNSRLFGGQVLAQALAAASLTVVDKPDNIRTCHSLHGYFLRPGDSTIPVLYKVEPIRDGKSFSTRRIVAIQKGEAIFSMDTSFQILEEGLKHQEDMPAVTGPESLEDDNVLASRKPESGPSSAWARRERPFHTRSVYQNESPPDDRTYPVWLRFREKLPDDQRLHQYLLAYASDMGFVSTSYLPHRGQVDRDKVIMASIDHAMWFHRQFRADDWILYFKETINSGGSRNFNRGSFYTRDGILVASAMQEGLMRVKP